MSDSRYWLLDAANETNRLDDIEHQINDLLDTENHVVGIVDDKQGIIAYALSPFAGEIVDALNAHKTD